jgi:hypothetical protein
LLGCAATERSELVAQRTPYQLEISLVGVRMAAGQAGIDSPLHCISVEIGAVEKQPVAAPRLGASIPWLEGLADWLAGGMCGGLNASSVSRANLALVEQARLDQAVVFVTSDWQNWQSYGSVFRATTSYLDRGILFARDLGEIENGRLMMRYAEHRW